MLNSRRVLTRRKFFRRVLIGGSVVAAAGAIDGFFIEPKAVINERIDITLARLPEEFQNFRIAQISDIHFGPYMGKAGVERALRLAETFNPELVLLTGDFTSHPFGKPNGPEGARFAEPCADVLVTMRNVPQIAVLGNHDHWNNANIVEAALRERGIEVLRNKAIPLERGKSRVWIAGVDDAIARAADLARTLKSVPSTETTILLAHEPDFADHAARFPVDVQFSGHSHGGQVRIPGIGALVCPQWHTNIPLV